MKHFLADFEDISDQLNVYINKNFNEIYNSFMSNFDRGLFDRYLGQRFILKAHLSGYAKDPLEIFNATQLLTNLVNKQSFFNEISSDICSNTKLIYFNNFPQMSYGISRLFAVYTNPELRKLMNGSDKVDIPVHVFFHPGGANFLETNKHEYVTKHKIHDTYLDLIARYIYFFKGLGWTHALAKKVENNKEISIPSILILPVFTKTAYRYFPSYNWNMIIKKDKGKDKVFIENSKPKKKNRSDPNVEENEEVKTESNFCFYDIIVQLTDYALKNFYQRKGKDKLSAIAISGYSQGNEFLNRSLEKAVFDLKNKNAYASSNLIRAIYFFDPSLKFKFNSNLMNTWLADDPRKMRNYKFYTAYSPLPYIIKEKVYLKEMKRELEEIRSQQNKNNYIKQNLEKFNKKPRVDLSRYKIYQQLINPDEQCSNDNMKYIFRFNLNNFQEYGYVPSNYYGLDLDDGHSWFFKNCLNHALANTDFS